MKRKVKTIIAKPREKYRNKYLQKPKSQEIRLVPIQDTKAKASVAKPKTHTKVIIKSEFMYPHKYRKRINCSIRT
jgi:hypothetical protein